MTNTIALSSGILIGKRLADVGRSADGARQPGVRSGPWLLRAPDPVWKCLTIAGQLDADSISINGGSSESGPYAPLAASRTAATGSRAAGKGLMEFVRIKNVNIRLG
jgi:hypothetical protein